MFTTMQNMEKNICTITSSEFTAPI